MSDENWIPAGWKVAGSNARDWSEIVLERLEG